MLTYAVRLHERACLSYRTMVRAKNIRGTKLSTEKAWS
jgi:hypothetical protein